MTHGEMPANLRLFVGLSLPAPIVHLLSTTLPRRGLDARWHVADDLHLTLRFLGPVAPAREPAIIAALQTVRRPPFMIEMHGLDVFNTPRQPVLYAGIASTRKLTTLCAEVTDALQPLGFDYRAYPFVPHVTLARLNRAASLDDYVARHDGSVRGSWQADRFHLFESATAKERGAQRYYPRATFLLS